VPNAENPSSTVPPAIKNATTPIQFHRFFGMRFSGSSWGAIGSVVG
jgi:hypothetical protein